MAEFLTRTTKLPPYLMFPRFLLNMKLPETSKILYIVLLDRARLSQQNEGWIDEYGHVFLYFPITNLAQELGKSEMTIKTSLATVLVNLFRYTLSENIQLYRFSIGVKYPLAECGLT